MDGFPFRGQFLPHQPIRARRAQRGRRPRRFIVRQPINPGLEAFAQFEAPTFVPDRAYSQLIDREISGRPLRLGTYLPWGGAYPSGNRAAPPPLVDQIGETDDERPEGFSRSFVMQYAGGRLERRRARVDENHITEAFGEFAFPPTPAILRRNPGFWPPRINAPLWPIVASRSFIGEPLDDPEAIRMMIDESQVFPAFQNFLPLWDAPLALEPYRRSASAVGPSLDDPFMDEYLNEPIFELNDRMRGWRRIDPHRAPAPKRDREEELYQASFVSDDVESDPDEAPRPWNDRPLKGRRLGE